MKIWTTDRSNNVHTQRTSLQYRATLHRTTRITLASLLFGRYACHWKALDEIYKVCMLLYRSDLNISANVHRFFGVFEVRNATEFVFSNLVVIFADFHKIC